MSDEFKEHQPEEYENTLLKPTPGCVSCTWCKKTPICKKCARNRLKEIAPDEADAMVQKKPSKKKPKKPESPPALVLPSPAKQSKKRKVVELDHFSVSSNSSNEEDVPVPKKPKKMAEKPTPIDPTPVPDDSSEEEIMPTQPPKPKQMKEHVTVESDGDMVSLLKSIISMPKRKKKAGKKQVN